jgi:hypothetical protein
LSRGRAAVNVPSAVDAGNMRAIHHRMTEDSTTQALARIDRALARIEAAAQRKPAPSGADSRYQALRTRTQAALASLENVIAQAGGRH